MNILSIESSCDETACAVVRDGHDILSNVVVSQIDIFKAYGGVIPEVAARSHLEAILPVVHKALDDAFPGKSESEQWDNIDAISVTHTPGLLGSLLIGTLTARTLAILHNKPFYPIHHLKSHIYSTWLSLERKGRQGGFENIVASPASGLQHLPIEHRNEVRTGTDWPKCCNPDHGAKQPVLEAALPTFPLLALIVSGGHTQIIRMNGHNDFEIIGTTRDDAIGECFDKVAKILGLPYPGGPSISNAALGHISLQNGKTFETSPGDRQKYKLPHPKVSGLDFSFSGLKTAVLRAVQSELNLPISFPSHDLPEKILALPDPARFIADFAASFEQTAINILLEKLSLALQKHPDTTSIIIAGGVSANSLLRHEATKIFFPDKHFSGDNAAMVSSATYYEIKTGVPPTDPYSLTLLPRSPIS